MLDLYVYIYIYIYIYMRLGSWSAAFKLVLIVLLPKPDGGSRCIGKTSMIYRIWGIMRRPGVKAWELLNVASWDACRPGSSALDAAYQRSLRVEIASRTGKHAAAMLWDFETFSTMSYCLLSFPAHLPLISPLIDLVLGLQMHQADQPGQEDGHGIGTGWV